MDKEFQSHEYITRERRIELSLSLGLSERQVKTWFQNRRMKQKRDRTVIKEEDNVNEVNHKIKKEEDH